MVSLASENGEAAVDLLRSHHSRELVGRGKPVRALVREGTDPSSLVDQGVEIVRGDMLDPVSIDHAFAEVGH